MFGIHSNPFLVMYHIPVTSSVIVHRLPRHSKLSGIFSLNHYKYMASSFVTSLAFLRTSSQWRTSALRGSKTVVSPRSCRLGNCAQGERHAAAEVCERMFAAV